MNRAKTRMWPKSLIWCERRAKAESLVADCRLSIKQIIATVGYSYTPNFTQDFKTCFGNAADALSEKPVYIK